MALPSRNTNSDVDRVQIVAKIFSEYGDFIYAVIKSKVKNDSQADDLFQDFFLSLVSRPPSDEVQNMKSYLYKSITNDIADESRRTQRYKAHIHNYSLKINCSVNKTSPEDALIEEEQMNKMFELIKEQLPSSRSLAITLRYRDGQSIKEIAEKMGVKRKSVSRYISTGLRKIRQLLLGK